MYALTCLIFLESFDSSTAPLSKHTQIKMHYNGASNTYDILFGNIG